LVGKQVPVEFTHNLTPSFNKFASYIDTKAFQFINSPMGDWTGVTNTPYQSGEPVILYFAKNSTLPFSLSEYLNKRSISFYNLVGNYIKDYPTSIPTFDQSNRSNSGYIWWSDSIISAEMLLLGGYPSL